MNALPDLLPDVRRADGATLVGLFVLALMIIPARLVFRGVPIALSPADVLSLVAFLCWLCATFTTTLGVAKGRTPVRTALFCYLVALAIGYGVATARYLPSDELKLADHALVLVIANVGIALLLCDGVRTIERLDFVLKTLVVAGALVGLIGALEFLNVVDLVTYLQKLPGLRTASDAGGVVEARNDLKRVAATAAHPIEFGVVCAMILPIALHYAFRAKDLRLPARRWWLCAMLVGAGLMFSVSRSAIVGLVVVLVILMIGWPGRRRAQVLVGGLALIGALEVTIPSLVRTLYGLFANAGQDSSVQYRQHRYQIAQDAINRHFWTGQGIGTWYVPKYPAFDNQWIHTTVEAGLIGAAALAGIFLLGIYSAIRVRWLTSDPVLRDLALSICAAIAVPMIASATFDLLGFGIATGLTFVLIGSSGSLLRIASGKAQEPPGTAPELAVPERKDHLMQGSGPVVEVT